MRKLAGLFALIIGASLNAQTHIVVSGGSSGGGGGTGSVTSVAATVPGYMTVSGTPITTSGTLAFAFASQAANSFFAAPNGSIGTPSFRAIVAADIPTLNQSTTGNAATASASNHSITGCGANTFVTGLSTAWALTCAQPAYSGISGTPTLPANTTATASNFFTAYNSTTGAFTKAQPAFTDVSGSLAHSQLPTLLSGDIPNNAADTTGKSAKTDALNSATTVVNVAAATAPSNGQVLTATDSTHATWQTPAGGSAPFSDAAAIVKNAADATKLFKIDASGITTGTTMTLKGRPTGIGIGTATTADSAADNLFAGSSSSSKILVLQQAPSFSGNVFEVQANNGSVVASIGDSGQITAVGNITSSGGSLQGIYRQDTWGAIGSAASSTTAAAMNASSSIGWSSGAHWYDAVNDTSLTRDAAGVVQFYGGTKDTTKGGYKVIADTSGSYYTAGSATELLTLSTSGTTTATVGNLVPANAQVEAILYRITTTITTATAFTVKVTSGAAAFVNIGTATSSQSVMTAGTTKVLVPSTLADQYNTSATTLTVTTTGTPGAGAIRLTVIYKTFSAPTS